MLAGRNLIKARKPELLIPKLSQDMFFELIKAPRCPKSLITRVVKETAAEFLLTRKGDGRSFL